MSSLSDSAVGGDGVPEKRGPGHPKGSRKKIEAPEITPPASQKHGRPKGSRNQKTLAALAAATTAPTTSTAIGVALALSGEGVPGKRGPGYPKASGRKTAPTTAAAPSSSRRRVRPPGSKNKKTLAALGAAASNSARPRMATSPPAGPSRLQPEKLALQPSAYISAEGWSTCLVSVLAGAKDLLRLPSQFAESMEGQEMAYATLRECSVGQPKYRVEVYYDGQGVCYFRNRCSKFFIDYGVHEGWFLLFTRRDGKRNFTVCIFDGTLSTHTFTAWS
jgi:hypothetical protein